MRLDAFVQPHSEVRAAVYKRPAQFSRASLYTPEDFTEKSVYSWNYKTGRFKSIDIRTEGHVTETHPQDSSLSVVASRFCGTLSLVDWKTEKELGVFTYPPGHYCYGHCAFSEGGDKLFVVSLDIAFSENNSLLYVLDVPSLKVSQVIKIPKGFSHDIVNLYGETFLTNSGGRNNGAFVIYDHKTGEFQFNPILPQENSEVITSIGHFKKFEDQVVASFQEPNYYQIDSFKRGALVQFDLKNQKSSIEMPLGLIDLRTEMLSLDYDPSTHYVWITVPAQRQVLVWDLTKGRMVDILRTDTLVTSVTVLPDIEAVFLGTQNQFMAVHSKSLKRLESIEQMWPHQKMAHLYCAHTRLA